MTIGGSVDVEILLPYLSDWSDIKICLFKFIISKTKLGTLEMVLAISEGAIFKQDYPEIQPGWQLRLICTSGLPPIPSKACVSKDK